MVAPVREGVGPEGGCRCVLGGCWKRAGAGGVCGAGIDVAGDARGVDTRVCAARVCACCEGGSEMRARKNVPVF